MTSAANVHGNEEVLKQWFKAKAAYGWALAGGLLAIAGYWTDELSFILKFACFGGCIAFACLGFFGNRWRRVAEQLETTRADDAEKEVLRLRAKLDESAPDAVLSTVASALFVKPGAWRMTLFVVVQRSDLSWCLKPLITRASSEVFEASPHEEISLSQGPLREILDVDVNNPLEPYVNESANLPERTTDPESWQRLNARIIQCPPNEQGMATRKYSWIAIKEPKSRRTIVLLSESILADGIHMDVVRSQLIAPTIALISRMIGVAVHDPEEVSSPDTVGATR